MDRHVLRRKRANEQSVDDAISTFEAVESTAVGSVDQINDVENQQVEIQKCKIDYSKNRKYKVLIKKED